MNLKPLQNASVSALEASFRRLTQFFPLHRWLNDGNRYSTDTISRITSDLRNNNIFSQELNEYIAASVLLHALDGWSYFGRAINSLFIGDVSIAKHLLYYSELRSAMSILAAQGIGVFDGKHFIIETPELSNPFPSQRRSKYATHNFVWDALDYWINNLNAVSSVLNIIKLDSISLENWLSSFGINEGMKQELTVNWLKYIGFDLNLFKSDKNARNEVSYRPTTINGVAIFDYKKILNEVVFCWNLCEPKSYYGLPKIDEMIISEFFYIFFEQITGPIIQNINEFKEKLGKSFDMIGIAEERKRHWLDIISNGQNINKVRKIFNFIKIKERTDNNFIIGMLYRALFLLRISIIYCEELVKDSRITKNDLEFWWSQIGYNYGLWNDHNSIEHFSDLWEDVLEELEKLNGLLSESSDDIQQYDIYNNLQISIAKLSSFERVHLWSIGL